MAQLEQQSATAATKLSHIEARTMGKNFKPHELIRQFQLCHSNFNPESDGSWPLRTMRDYALDYTRVLKRTYGEMSMVEMAQLVRLLMFEADGFIVVLWWCYIGFIVV